jgi:hypothetical protein
MKKAVIEVNCHACTKCPRGGLRRERGMFAREGRLRAKCSPGELRKSEGLTSQGTEISQ